MRLTFRTAAGNTCCDTDDPASLCKHCAAAHATTYPTPEPYAVGLAQLRAASAKPSDYERDYKLQRTMDMQFTRDALDGKTP